MKRIFCVLILLLVAVESAFAAPKTLSRDEVIGIINGNSIVGEQQGIRFVQYFAPNGQTVYQRASGVIDIGRWQVEDNGNVCTLWSGDVTACYTVQANVGVLEWIGPLDVNTKEVFTRTLLRPSNLTSVPMPTTTRSAGSVGLGNVISGFLEIY